VTESAATTTVPETPEAADRRAFEDALKADDAASRKKLVEGETVLGTIAGITPDVILVSLGGKTEALMEKSELEGLKVGDRIEAVVVKAGPDVRLSRRLALGQRTRAELRAASSAKIPVQGKVTARNKGGFEVALGGSSGLRAFCPVSQIDVGRHDDEALKAFLGQTFDFRILEYTEDGRRIVVSRAALLREEQDARAAEVREKIVPGAVLKGRVRSITDFGAFVDLGGIDGLIHVTEISRRRIAHAKDALAVGQDVDVKVLKIEQEGKRISLSMKELESDPWEGITSRLAAGAPFTGKIARHAEFGLFVELEPGIDGLVHVSQLPPGVTLKDAAVAVGESVTGWVKEIDPAHHRISLTLREVATSDPWDGIETKLPEGTVTGGEVENVATFGVFVHLAPGLTGLIPNSETGLPHGTPASKSFAPGQKVEVKIIGLDTKRRRISLSVAGAKAEADRVDVKRYREDSARREKEKAPAVSVFGASLLAALQNPKSKQIRK
jgi:small subunit ribosomal protein S1